MKRIWTIIAMLFVALPLLTTARLQAQTKDQSISLSTSDAHRLMKTAHESDQYHALAVYFRQKEQFFSAERDAELALWNSRQQGIAANQNRYPRPVDSAHNLYDYYAYETNHAAAQAQYYEQMTTIAEPK
jgi:hypothetical protein